MITLEQARNLKPGTILYHVKNTNADGTAQRWRVNGPPKTWQTRPGEVSVPIKHGMRDYDYLTQCDLALVNLEDD